MEWLQSPLAYCLEQDMKILQLYLLVTGADLNAVGLTNPGAEAFSSEISSNRDIPIIVSLVGSSEEDFPQLVNYFDSLNIIGYEINLSCPHVKKMGLDIGDDPEMVSKIVKAVKRGTKASYRKGGNRVS